MSAEGILEQRIASLNSRQQDMAFLSDVAQLFQACRTIEEVCKVARDRLQGLSPDLSGALYLMGETNKCLENVMAWGAVQASGAFFMPSDCWALRCGRPHQVSKGHDSIVCVHADAKEGDWHLCVPMMAQGEALGVLYFRVGTEENRRTDPGLIAEDRLHFYFNVSETLALAVANIRLRETLQHQAIRDPLTGLFNRRYFQETLKRELHRASRAKLPLSLVILDIDHFKRFNDTYGHDAGDAALKAVSEILISRTRAGDVACRHGGEEFVLAFPGLPAEVAASRVEALRCEIEARDIQFLGQTIDPVTISAGIAVYPGHAMDMDSLMRAADQALYQSKEAGRNRFTMAASRRSPAAFPPLTLVHNAAAAEETAAPATGKWNVIVSAEPDPGETPSRDIGLV
jgi:diguanylate cyclase (GGDEF)-like protein